MCTPTNTQTNERGQATIALVGVIAIAVTAMVALAIYGEAVLHRAQARNAADAVALAAAVDDDAAHALAGWYRQHDIDITQSNSVTIAQSGPSRAAAWASVERSSTQPAPALVAIVARAEQLLDVQFSMVRWEPTAVMLTRDDAINMGFVATDLGLCEATAAQPDDGFVRYELC